MPSTTTKRMVNRAWKEARLKHGPLKGGMARWAHHLTEECEEAVAEMRSYSLCPQSITVDRMMMELAQVAQLAESMLDLIISGSIDDPEDPYRAGGTGNHEG